MRRHVAAIGEVLDLSTAHVERMTRFLAAAERSDIEALSAVAPMVAGVKEGGRWSIDAASAARRIGKPVTLVVTANGKGVEVELVTGKVRLQTEH